MMHIPDYNGLLLKNNKIFIMQYIIGYFMRIYFQKAK